MARIYFRLAPDCFLIAGPRDAAIYDLGHQRLYILNPDAAALLRRCERNEPVDPTEETAEMLLLQAMADQGLGFFLAKPHFVEKLQLQSPVRFKGIGADPPRFERLSWQITRRCNFSCRHCGAKVRPVTWQACSTCLMRGDTSVSHGVPSWNSEMLNRLLDDLAAMEFRTLHLRGGNPLLEEELLREIADRVERGRLSLTLMVTTPGVGRFAGLLGRRAVRFNIVLLGTSPADYAITTGDPGAWREIQRSVQEVQRADSLFSITLLLTPETRGRKEENVSYIQKTWGVTPIIAEAYPYSYFTSTGAETPRFTHVGPSAKPLFPFRDQGEFFFRTTNNTCLAGTVDLGPHGCFRPCAWLDEVLGRWPADTLHAVMSRPQTYHYWELIKDNISSCKNCPLRYACADCTAVELEGERLPAVKKAYCPFEPEKGDGTAAVERPWEPREFVRKIVLSNLGGMSIG